MSRRTSAIRGISFCGSRQSRGSQGGRRPLASRHPAGPAGTSSARRWHGNISARRSTYTAAASISCSRITRTKSPNRAAPSIRQDGKILDAQRLPAGRRREDVEEPGNFVTINELLKDWPGAVLRFQMLKTHYRQPIDWTRKGTESGSIELACLKPSRRASAGVKPDRARFQMNCLQPWLMI